MSPEEFIAAYETALGTQSWKAVEPLVSENVGVTFSDGTVHMGKANVQKAFEKNFQTIKNEKYGVENVEWLVRNETYAVYLFEFYWTGIIDGKSVSGNGVGTSVLIKEGARWKLLTEHLGRKSR
ncbi:YybH family protein [Flagellimonas flava]|uniref:DUF4440 domain-containing protein n=1 Tax=Flagellimonas flava TaxID=570519 RepID=A0A1M5IKL1_9FLAO|nr:nuclear transport factor 2 family protein [Allomuricauda flava]SHG28579.1 protein of unknown function [Allomuricauda flava]